MSKKNILWLIFFNLFGAALFLSWYLPPMHGFWFSIDSGVFFFFNHLLARSDAFRYLVALTNLRPFDGVAFLAMLSIFGFHYRRADARGRRRMIAIGLTMLIAAVIAKQFDMAMSFHRLSPTSYFRAAAQPVLRVSELTGWPAKDASGTSFPGDHAMMLLIFTWFMLRYFGKRTFLASLAVFLLFSLPRVMSGAHWLTDIVVGAGSICAIVLSWLLLTPASDWLVWRLTRLLARHRR